MKSQHSLGDHLSLLKGKKEEEEIPFHLSCRAATIGSGRRLMVNGYPLMSFLSGDQIVDVLLQLYFIAASLHLILTVYINYLQNK